MMNASDRAVISPAMLSTCDVASSAAKKRQARFTQHALRACVCQSHSIHGQETILSRASLYWVLHHSCAMLAETAWSLNVANILCLCSAVRVIHACSNTFLVGTACRCLLACVAAPLDAHYIHTATAPSAFERAKVTASIVIVAFPVIAAVDTVVVAATTSHCELCLPL